MIVRTQPFDGHMTIEEVEYYLSLLPIVKSDIIHHDKLYGARIFFNMISDIEIEENIRFNIDFMCFTLVEFKLILAYIGSMKLKVNRTIMKAKVLNFLQGSTDLLSRVRFVFINGYYLITKSNYYSFERLNRRRCLLKSSRGDLEINYYSCHSEQEINNFQIVLEYSEIVHCLLCINSWSSQLNDDVLNYIKLLLRKDINAWRFERVREI